MPTAAILIIGDEILTGKVRDENSPWLLVQLRQMSIEVESVTVLPDSVNRIASTLRALSARVDFVFTSGGLGPTHDDRTMEAVSMALEQGLVPHPELSALIEGWISKGAKNATEAEALRNMCLLPVDSEVHRPQDGSFPLVMVQNIAVLPGVPHLLKKKFAIFRALHGSSLSPVKQTLNFETKADETAFAAKLSRIQSLWPDLAIGSYPRRTRDGWRTTITIDGYPGKALDGCAADVRALLSDLDG